jgi:hypothetical protein
MTTNRAQPLKRAGLVTALLFGAALAVTGGPALAGGGGNDGGGKRAKEACRELLKDRGFKNIDLSDMRTVDDGDNIVLEVDAKREGDKRSLRCSYDKQDRQAYLVD